ncbi:response regulator transcription factor [Alsobacter sp. R-9]
MSLPAADPLRILVIEDSPSLRRTVVDYMRASGFAALEAWSVAGAKVILERTPPDIVLLDLMLEDGEGYELLELFAPRGIPLMVVSAKASTEDRIHCLERGADDYLVKPFELRELLLRVRRLERLLGTAASIRPGSATATLGAVRIDMVERSVQRPEGSAEHLTDAEFRLLRLLLDNAGTILSRERIEAEVFRREVPGDSRRVDVLVSKLRRKIDDPSAPSLVANVRNLGYVLQVSAVPG